jgi:hypothetical protein
MRLLAITLASLIAAAFACGECVVVAEPSLPSHQNVRLTVLRDGKPRKNVTIAVNTWLPNGKQASTTITTDALGIAELKELSPGQYCFTATTDTQLSGALCLDVSKFLDAAPSEFSLLLSPLPPPPPTLYELAREAEKLPIELRGPTFEGVVKDISGAGIAKAEIAIYRRASEKNANPVKLSADEHGRFLAPLSPGAYTGVIQSQGFKTRFMGIEIAPEAPKLDMLIVLNVAHDTC